MNFLGRSAWVIMLFAIAAPASWVDRIDLPSLLAHPDAMAKLLIEYDVDDKTSLFVYGTGEVVKQAHLPLSSSLLVPTCRGKVTQEEIRGLISAMIDHHFWDLPARSYMYMTASDDESDFWKKVKLHAIFLDDGKDRATRQFAAAIYHDRQETIPPDFAAIESVLEGMGRSTGRDHPCGMAPQIKLPPDSIRGRRIDLSDWFPSRPESGFLWPAAFGMTKWSSKYLRRRASASNLIGSNAILPEGSHEAQPPESDGQQCPRCPSFPGKVFWTEGRERI